MKKNKYCLLFLCFLIAGCDNKKSEEVGIYAYNMLYACGDCATYKIFRVDNLSDSKPKLKDKKNQLDTYAGDKEIEDEIQSSSISNNNQESLIGKEIHLKFKNSKADVDFYNNAGTSPICYIYYFQGRLNRNILLVNSYKIILKSPKCLSK